MKVTFPIMNTIPLISSNHSIFTKITSLIQNDNENEVETIVLTTAWQAIEYLNIEMPELVIIDFSDKSIDAFALLDHIMGDPWLLHGGIIVLCDENENMERIQNIRGANIIVDLYYDDINSHLNKVFSIIYNNRRILFQRQIGSDLIKNISGSFKLNNDTIEVKCYVNLICNFLYNSNLLDTAKKFQLQLALTEMLLNAIEHGNCHIDYDEKTAWLEKHGSIIDLICERIKDPLIEKKKVLFDYEIRPSLSRFFIADEGKGFDWRKIKDASMEENLLQLHGRGIMMTRNVSENLTYNEKGNEVSFEIKHQENIKSITPGLFENINSKDIKPDDVVFREGEPSNFLYYIVKGTYNIIVNSKVISSLNEDDIFMGEMSFLLNNMRSATVKAKTHGKLIEVSKKDFIEAIKKRPHYALFLSRLLAQRIQRSNQKQ